MQRNQKSIKEQINNEKKRVLNVQKGKPFQFTSNKELKYTKKFPDNKSAFYYPLKKNFMSNEEEKKFNHYYGEEFIDRVSRIDRTNKRESYLQDDIISNLIFLYLLTTKTSERELLVKIKITFKIKSCTRLAIIHRIKTLYDRYHGYLDDNKNEKEFWYMSCKRHEKKNILTLFQNNKQLYCNIHNIYDCSFHSNIDPNFDNPSIYDQVKFLKSFKKLIEFSLYSLFGNSSNNLINNHESNEMIIEEQSDNENEEKKDSNNKLNINNNYNNMNNININNNNNDIISNASSKMLSYSNSKETDEIVNEIIIENSDGINKVISLKKKDSDNLELMNDSFKNHITDLAYEFNHILKNIRCQNNIVPQIKKIKGIEKEDRKPCSELCYKNFLICEEKLHDKTYLALKDKQFPPIYELLLIKFLLTIKFDPCHIFKVMKIFMKDIQNFNLNCTDIYIHCLSKKFSLRKIIKKELFDLNLKERELSKKNKASLTPAQSKKIEENNLKNINLNYLPCIHFGNEICDDKCLCSKRGFCEIYCRCNKILCKSSFHGCHCFKGDCTSNHCPCFNNGRECNPQRCKNCNIQYSDEIRCKNLKLQMDYESKLIVGISPISGWGLFSNEFIKKDSLIGEYKGELITDEIVNKRDKFREYENCTYMFKLDDEYTIDSRKMGNMLRYANHSKINSNSYTKIVFSEGQRKIVLFAKRDIYKGEEILFDYDGQGILGKQFSWINDEKKINIQKLDNSINIKEKSVNNNHKSINPMKKEIQNKKSNSFTGIKSTNTIIRIDDIDDNINIEKNENIVNSPENEFNNNIHKDTNIINNDVEEIKEYNIIDINENNNNNVDKIVINNSENKEKKKDINKSKSINVNKLNKPILENPSIEKNKIEGAKQKDKNINNIIQSPKNNIIDILSEEIKSNNTKNTNETPKVIFKTEDNDLMNFRNKLQKGNKTNIFDWMCKIGENLEQNNTKLLNKKRNLQNSNENKVQTRFNFNINSNPENNINNNSSPKKIFLNTEKKNETNFEINNSNNKNKLKKPIFASENNNDSNKIENNNNNFFINNKIRYNFITCQNFNIIERSNSNQENKINAINTNTINDLNFFNQSSFSNNFQLDNKNFNINNINLGFNKDKNENNKSNIKYYNLGIIRIILEFDNPILNDFKLYSSTNTDILRNIQSIKCKTFDLTNSPVDVDLERDIYGYLLNNTNYKGYRIFNDYLDIYDNMSYFSFIPEINSDIYIISKGPLYNKIRDVIDLKNNKLKKLLFFIKKKI